MTSPLSNVKIIFLLGDFLLERDFMTPHTSAMLVLLFTVDKQFFQLLDFAFNSVLDVIASSFLYSNRLAGQWLRVRRRNCLFAFPIAILQSSFHQKQLYLYATFVLVLGIELPQAELVPDCLSLDWLRFPTKNLPLHHGSWREIQYLKV